MILAALLLGLCAIQGTLAADCGHPKIAPKSRSGYIVGGEEATPHSWPWMTALMSSFMGGTPSQICGASIISDRWILTAGHCFDFAFLTEFSVGVGYHNLNVKDTYQQHLAIEKYIVHEKYETRDPSHDDIALIKLAKPLQFNDGVQPVCLPPKGQEWTDEVFTVTGWGQIGENRRGSNVLLQVNVPHIPMDICSSYRYYGNSVDKWSTFCAGYSGGQLDSCAGDSGGPIVIKQNGNWVQAGVVSWGQGCARAYSPGVYTHVSRFMSWIESTMAKN